jgi:uncharacterized protein
MLKACLDTNIWLSGTVFHGKPGKIVDAAYARKFEIVISQFMLDEIEKNLLNKLDFGRKDTKRVLNRILQLVDLYEPKGSVNVLPDNNPDNIILETAHIGGAKYLVTGDKKDLLPLKMFKHVKIISAEEFLDIIKR